MSSIRQPAHGPMIGRDRDIPACDVETSRNPDSLVNGLRQRWCRPLQLLRLAWRKFGHGCCGAETTIAAMPTAWWDWPAWLAFPPRGSS